jgi:dephospho-CoA kinase
MLRVGLTGGLASGKSTAARMLQEHGFHVLDADLVARRLLEPGTATYTAVVEAFGSHILSSGAGSAIDRAKLAALAFADDAPRVAELNAIVHPAVISEQTQWMDGIATRDPHGIAVVEAALILEAGAARDFDRILLVTAPEELRIERFAQRAVPAGVAEREMLLEKARAEARKRIAVQIPESKKVALSDYVAENATTVEALKEEIDAIVCELRRVEQAR